MSFLKGPDQRPAEGEVIPSYTYVMSTMYLLEQTGHRLIMAFPANL